MKYIIVFISIILVCYMGYDVVGKSKNIILDYYQKDNVERSILRLDGFYSMYDTSILNCGEKLNERYKVVHPLVFMKMNRVYHHNRDVSNGIPDFEAEYYQHRGVGKFRIVGDSIYANIPSTFAISGMRMRQFNANYTGYIKNKDTIVGWKMIPPYPNVKPKWNDYFIKDTAPKMLYFIKHENVKELEKYVK